MRPVVRASDWRTAAAAILTSSTLAIPGNVLPILTGLFADTYHLNEQLIGYLISTNTATALIVSLAAPLWITKVNVRWLVPICMAVVGCGYWLLAIMPSYPLLLLLEVVIGAGTGAIASVCYTVIAQLADPARAWGIKVVSDVLFAWAFMKTVPSDEGMLRFTLVLACVLAISGALGRLLPGHAVIRRGDDGALAALRSAPVNAWLALLVVVVFSIGAAGVWAFVQRLELRAGISAADASDVFALGLLLGVTGAVAAAWLGVRLGRAVLPSLAGTVLVGTVYVMTTTHSEASFAAALVALNIAWAFFLPYMMGLLAAQDASNRLASLVNAALTTGGIVGPSLAGTLIHVSGYPVAMAVQGTLIAVAVAIYLFVAMSDQRAVRVPTAIAS